MLVTVLAQLLIHQLFNRNAISRYTVNYFLKFSFEFVYLYWI